MKLTRTLQMTLGLAVAGLFVGGAYSSSAQVTQQLFAKPTATPIADNYSGALGTKFVVGATNVVVSHIGVYGPSGLASSHQAGILDASGTVLVGGVTVPAGTGSYMTNGYNWVPLDPPVMLTAGHTYIVACLPVSGDGDQYWNQGTPQSWNPWFIGANASSTAYAMYGPAPSSAWPPPSMSQAGSGKTYGSANLGYLEVGQARAGVQQTNVSIGDGQTLTVVGFGTGQQPISYQWYTAPNTPVPNQTNATLVISNATVSASGTYYLVATNSLGSEQSANVTVSVTSFPVGITQNPTNTTAFANYPVTFSLVATGTPSIYYQWSRNGSPIPGATRSSYSLTAYQTNNGDVYACVVSNYLSSGPHTATSSGATLSVLANLALPQTLLHGARKAATNNFTGTVGGLFTVGNAPALVTHLGYYATQFTDAYQTNATLSTDHHVGIFSADGSTLYASVVVSAGTHDVVSGYMWTALASPLMLSNNTQYLLVAEVFSGLDPWGDAYAVPDWNPYYVANGSTAGATYWGGSWPTTGVGGNYGGQMYSAPNLAVLAPAIPVAYAQPTTVTQYVSYNVTFTGTVAGQAPVVAQWCKEPGVPLNGQTNLNLSLTNLGMGDAGSYFLLATNPVSLASAQSSDATLTVVPDTSPSVDQDIQSQTVYLYQTVSFAPSVSGTPPLSYQWLFNGSPLAGATGSTLSLAGASAANAGTYRLTVTNNWGTTNTSAASLQVIVPAWGSYPSAVMGTNLLTYYRFSDVNSGLGVATNQGSLGAACNGTYEGGYAGVSGPTGLSNFESTNLAVSLDGYSADVAVQVQTQPSVSLGSATLAAWVYQSDSQAAAQVPDAAIVFHRPTTTTDVFGLSVTPDPVTGGAALRYTWNGTYYTFASGLVLPTNQWAFVAMTITPTNATLYLQDGTGMRSTNNPATHSPCSFSGPSYIGYDSAGGSTGRRWNGSIDEVMVFNTALSPTAVNALYLGVPAAATLSLTPSSAGQAVLTWPGGTLLEATNVAGPWTAVTGATSPHTVTESGTGKYYRVRLQ